MQSMDLTYFGGVTSSIQARALKNEHSPASLNARTIYGALSSRLGYKNLAAAQATFTALYGFGYLKGYTAAYAESEEYVSVENIGGTVGAYTRDKSTLAPTLITGATGLHASDWVMVAFNTYAYLINPNSTIDVYRHTLGDSTSWVGLAIPTDPVTALTYRIDFASGGAAQYATLSWAGTDLADNTVTGCCREGASLVDSSGNFIILHENSEANGSFEIDLSAITAGTQNWTYNDCFGFTLTPKNPSVFDIDPASVQVTLTNADGSPKTLIPTSCVVKETNTATSSYYVRLQFDNKTRADWDNIKKVKVAYKYTKASGTQASNEMSMSKWTLGCCIFAKANERLPGSVMRFGYGHYASAIGGGLTSGVAGTVDIPVDSLKGLSPFPDTDPLGCWPTFTMTDSADANVDNHRLYWFDDEGKWRLIVTQSDGTDTYTLQMSRQELLALTQYTPGPFKVTNCTNAFAYREGLVWLYAEQSSNVRFSRINAPENQFSQYDEEDDENRGRTMTLSETFGDVPVCGVQAGDSALIGGLAGVYESQGEKPYLMTPFKRIPSSLGVASKFAMCRFKDDYGNPGAVFVDAEGSGVWFALPSGTGDRDAEGRCFELTEPIQGFLRLWLLDGQRSSLGLTDFSTARVFVDEVDDSLFIVMGRRGLKLSSTNVLVKRREWYPIEWNTGSSTATIKYVAASAKRRVRWMRSTGQADENEFNQADAVEIAGYQRDGGNVMPQGYWQSKTFAGGNSRILRFRLDRKYPHIPARVIVDSDRLTQPYALAAGKFWVACPLKQQGHEHFFKIVLTEDQQEYTGLTWEMSALGKRYAR